MSWLRACHKRVHETKGWSPGGFALRAGAILVLYLVAHVAGLRECTSFLSGTMPLGSFGQYLNGFLGIAYVLVYIGAVIVAPILIVAAGVFFLLQRWVMRRRQEAASP